MAVELRLNGTPVGRKQPRGLIARFRIPYQSGTLEAISLDKAGAVIGRSSLQTGARPTLRITADRLTLCANQQDLAYLMIELKDAQGILSPLSGVQVQVECVGAGTLQGFGSAACVTDERFTDSLHMTWQGRCLAVIRADADPGTIRFTAKTEAYGEAAVCLTVKDI